METGTWRLKRESWNVDFPKLQEHQFYIIPLKGCL